MYRTLFITFFFIFLTALYGQSRESFQHIIPSSKKSEKAIRAFNDMAYPSAIEIFEDLLREGTLNAQEKGLLAVTYYRLNEPVKAAYIFTLIGEEKLSGEFLYTYARVLQSLEKYRSAERIMKRYAQENPDDTRAREQINTLKFVQAATAIKRYEISPLEINSSNSDFGPFWSNETLFFASDRAMETVIKRRTARDHKPYLNVFKSVKQGQTFSHPDPLFPKLKSIFHDGPLCFNADGTEIFLTRNTFHSVFKQKGNDNYNRLMIVHFSRNAEGKWDSPTELPINEPESSSGHPFLTQNGKRLWFTSNREGGFGGSDIWYADRSSDGWHNPVNAGKEINTEGNEMFPFEDNNGILYFSSDGHLGMGGLDLFMAKNTDGKYVTRNMGHPINSGKDDFSIYVNNDGRTGFFASNRPGGQGDDDLYRFSVIKPVSFEEDASQLNEEAQNQLKLRVVDQESENPVEGVIAGVLDNRGQYLGEAVSEENGEFVINGWTKGDITIMAAAEFYYPYEKTLPVSESPLIIRLSPIPLYGIYGQVTRSDNGSPLSDVTITVSSASRDTKTFTTDYEGRFRIRLHPYSNYQLEFSRTGFSSIQTDYSTFSKSTGYLNLNLTVPLKMKPAF
ncbi:carboxypeptidase regulatory-like domain-containing protein [Marinilabilia salmonicolor]|uniref:carboxypeptidase regulatory-like domain-containing protein n=1 Tax=Marinilabilia salmonicolor TaxID=989 RepID=UPI00029B004C|nr:carboxypeptidase regulatory-like domain-containing protein [Marinilabilia salmonicolor]